MLAFKVLLNGKKLATIGIDGAHVLTAIVSSVVRRKEDRLTWKDPSVFTTRELELDLGGLASYTDGAKEHVRWAHRRVKVGDTVTIKIVRADRVDEPRYRGGRAFPQGAVQHGVAPGVRPRTAARR